jgi:enoyl-CoA hydratase/carnithine racemase
LRIDNPPVNAISVGVREAIIHGVQQLQEDPALKAAVLICAGRTFMAGADITEFGKTPLEPGLQKAIDALAQSKKLVVAAIHGTAFGGGLEIALACNYRVAQPSAQVGLPEVKLGILPGAGGTQRLPRLIGVPAALDMIVGGDPIPAPKAAKLGIVDQIVEGDLLEAALAYTQQLVKDQAPLRRVRDLSIDAAGLSQRTFTDHEIVERCMLPLMNVGCDVLEEGVAYRAGDIDIVYLYGYSFPAYRGGPMFWAENEVGLAAAFEKIKGFSQVVGEKWTKPSALLERLVANNASFASLEK